MARPRFAHHVEDHIAAVPRGKDHAVVVGYEGLHRLPIERIIIGVWPLNSRAKIRALDVLMRRRRMRSPTRTPSGGTRSLLTVTVVPIRPVANTCAGS